MGKVSHIEWTDATHNFWYGCRRVSPGCARCYANREMTRFGRDFNTVTRAKGFDAPLKWKRTGLAPGGGLLIFVNSWSDFFIEESDDWRDDAWDIIRRTPQHTYQILTKRPERILDGKKIPDRLPVKMCFHCGNTPAQCSCPTFGSWPWPNVWLGTSIETESHLGRMATLGKVPAKVRFISAEPLLGPIDFLAYRHGTWFRTIHWVITGGESDYTNPRPAKKAWFLDIRDQCREMNIPFFHKQHGGQRKCPCHDAWGCRILEGRTWDSIPEVHDPSFQTQTSLS